MKRRDTSSLKLVRKAGASVDTELDRLAPVDHGESTASSPDRGDRSSPTR